MPALMCVLLQSRLDAHCLADSNQRLQLLLASPRCSYLDFLQLHCMPKTCYKCVHHRYNMLLALCALQAGSIYSNGSGRAAYTIPRELGCSQVPADTTYPLPVTLTLIDSQGQPLTSDGCTGVAHKALFLFLGHTMLLPNCYRQSFFHQHCWYRTLVASCCSLCVTSQVVTDPAGVVELCDVQGTS
jgi:hypothetical protein